MATKEEVAMFIETVEYMNTIDFKTDEEKAQDPFEDPVLTACFYLWRFGRTQGIADTLRALPVDYRH